MSKFNGGTVLNLLKITYLKTLSYKLFGGRCMYGED